ncbi:MAG: response regulator [Candidatus Marinimicrobia bacterium]|nr:response regulator [Candidatus Neomarinimicrobiota bacterium]
MDNSNITVLIVDDTAANLQVLTSIVTTQGYNILLAQSGEEALEAANQYHPDIILLDIMMSRMDGYEVCRILKEKKETRQIPVIFVTARTDVEAIEKGFDVGGDDYVSKPFNDRVLLARLKTHVERYQLQREIVREHTLMTAVLEDSPIMFCRFNSQKEIEYVNRAFEFWFSDGVSKLTGINLLKAYPERKELAFIRNLDVISLQHQSDTRIFSFNDIHGEIHYIQWTYRGIYDKQNHLTAYQCFGKDVTEQQLMIQELNARNTLLEHSQIVGKMMNWEMDPETRIVTFEGDVSSIIGGIVRIFNLKTLFQYAHPDDVPYLEDKLREYLEGNETVNAFFRVIIDGVTYHLRISAFYERDKSGKTVAYRGVFQDITELVRYREQSERLRLEKASIFEALSEGIVMFDLEHHIVQANDAAAKLVGKEKASDIIGKKCHSVFHRLDKECVPCTAINAIREGRRVQAEKPYGKGRIWSVSSTPIYNKDGEVVNVIEVLSDTTELHRRQRELILSRERLNTAFDAAQIGTFTILLLGKKWIPDNQLMRLYGIEGEERELPLSQWYERVHQDDLPNMLNNIEKFFRQQNNTCKFEFRLRDHDDRFKWFRCSMQAIEYDKKGNPSLVIGVSIDITREHTMLDTIREQEESLAQSRKLKAMGQLTGGIAHDFNNMLATILGFAELLSEELQEDKELSYYCKNIIDTCERAATLTNQLLTFARKQRKQSTAIDMHDLVLSSLDLLRHALGKNIDIRHHLTAKEHFIMGEYTQLQNVLLNLAFNAHDAMPVGGVFTLRTENVSIYEKNAAPYPLDMEPGNYFRLDVIDNGVGMEREVLSKIFEPFFTTKSTGLGTGLGLSSVYGTVNAHNGYIYADSRPMKGSTFHLFFPVSALKPDAHQGKQQSSIKKEFSGNTVLIIDDEEAIRRMLNKSLGYMGLEVLEAADGSTGVELYRKYHEKISLIILDVIMPGMDGVTTYKKLREIDPGVAVLISSGFANNEQTNALRDLGVKAYLKKPYRQSDLQKMIKKILGKA